VVKMDSMSFPEQKFSNAADYVDAYFQQIGKAAASVNKEKIEDAARILDKAYSNV